MDGSTLSLRHAVALVAVSCLATSWGTSIIKTDLDADFNRDGKISNTDPCDNGLVQEKPPGLPVVIGAMEPLVLRVSPAGFTEGVARLVLNSRPELWKTDLDTGTVESLPAQGGRARVWQDSEKKTLLLDSHDSEKQVHEWVLSRVTPLGSIPLRLYAEGVAASSSPGDVVLVFECVRVMPQADGDFTETILSRDRIVATVVARAPKKPMRRTLSKDDSTTKEEAETQNSAEQMAIWCFDGTPTFADGKLMSPTVKHANVNGAPTLALRYQTIDADGKDGIAYTDVKGVAHTATKAAAWDDIRGDGTDAKLELNMNTMGWEDIQLRLDYKSELATSHDLEYSLDGGVTWGTYVENGSLVAGYTWQVLTVDLTSLAAVENKPAIKIRVADLDREPGNGKFVFDNVEVTGVRLPTGGPTVRAVDTTTRFLQIPFAGPAVVSGVIGDATDPAAVFGIDFMIADPDTPLTGVTVTAAAAAVAGKPTAAVTLTLTGTSSARNLKITPTSPGYADVTVTASDGALAGAYKISYAASAASNTPESTRHHTGCSDASTAAAVDGDYMIVANDEGNLLRLVSRDQSGMVRAHHDFSSQLGLAIGEEADFEGGTRVANRLYWIGSHGNTSAGNVQLSRHRLFATDMSGSGEATTLAYVGRYDNLRADLIAWDNANGHGKGAGYYGLEASAVGQPKRDDGFNIEGLAMAPGSSTTAYLGFRAPLVPPAGRRNALVIPVTNFTALMSGGPARFGVPIELDLGGRGIRAFERNAANEYLIVAGPPDAATGTPPSDFHFYFWAGTAGALPALLTGDAAAQGLERPYECIVEMPASVSGAGTVQFLCDNGTMDWYGDGQPSKTLTPAWQKFRSERIAIGTATPSFAMTLGDGGENVAYSVVQTRDGGYIAAGYTNGPARYDLWACKLDVSGAIQWQKRYGGPDDDGTEDARSCIRQTADGGYIFVSETHSFSAGQSDYWVLRLNGNGDIVWQKAYGGYHIDTAKAVCEASNGDFVVAGDTVSFGAGAMDMWILRVDAAGKILWQKTYGTTGYDLVESIELGDDGGFILAASANRTPCLLKIDGAGQRVWSYVFGGPSIPEVDFAGICRTPDGGFVAVSSLSGAHVVKLGSNGQAQWQKSYQGAGLGYPKAVNATHDGGYIIASSDMNTIALLRLDGSGGVLWCRQYGGKSTDHISSVQETLDGGFVVGADTKSYGAGDNDMYILKVTRDGIIPGYRVGEPVDVAVTDKGLGAANVVLAIRDTQVSDVLTKGTTTATSVSPNYLRLP